MSNISSNDAKSKETAIVDVDFQWGKMPQQDLSGQFTRSMMEMRKPKPYELTDPPPLLKSQKIDDSPAGGEFEIPQCPIVVHTIKLLKYIRQVRDLISKLESRSIHGYSNQFKELSCPPPPLVSENLKTAASVARRSRSSSSDKSVEIEPEEKFLFAAPKSHTDFRSGIKISHFPEMDGATTSRILKRSVATVAAHTGYVESTSSSLNVLTGVAESFMISFSKSLRNAADLEAETGNTAFYDCLDQALHESGCSNLKEIENFWQTRIVNRNRMLQRQADTISKTLQSIKYPKAEEVKKQAKQESTAFPASYGKWTPVTGMSSSPFSTGRTTDTSSEIGWGIQEEKSSVKSEPEENTTTGTLPSSSYSFITAPQPDNSQAVKSEYSGFEISTRSPSTELLNGERNVSGQTNATDDQFSLDDQQGLYGMEDYRPSRKKTRNL